MTQRFAALHVPGAPFLLPNAWDVASALLLADTGPAIGTTSLGVTAAAGLPDGAGAGAQLTVDLVRRLAGRLPVPLTVDLEGGYSDDPGRVAALVEQLAGYGVAGVNLEDGARPAAVHAAIVRAVVNTVPQVFVNARTDTWWRGVDRDTTVDRLRAYRDAGAHGVFVPGLTDLQGIAEVVRAVGVPLNVLWWPGAALADLAAAGVARVSTGSALYRQALGAALGLVGGDGAPVGYAALQQRLARRGGGGPPAP